ncbi:hypothetical protein [Streptomyces sp. NBC_00576]|uniref:hypothetical protein n=1 Tax=Streptomyces sp. NBC_00576 TaxID=2903665 RepID=UPI002E82393A|nr:hypothetical protein [Streptomyces sp. NBC_00576]WUB76115.1 hypothetical protein OG734_42110 [Streptomyces sp. NBC_00576]
MPRKARVVRNSGIRAMASVRPPSVHRASHLAAGGAATGARGAGSGRRLPAGPTQLLACGRKEIAGPSTELTPPNTW